jgi:hypothetical protein
MRSWRDARRSVCWTGSKTNETGRAYLRLPDQYWQLAQDCFKLAATISAGEARKILLDMGREWQQLADQQERATHLRKNN